MLVGFNSPDMTVTRNQRIILSITALLFSTLACRAATRLIIPDTPTPPPTPTATFTPTLTPSPSPTPTVFVFEASCPLVVDEIIEDAIYSTGSSSNEQANSDEEITHLVYYSVVENELKTPLFDSVKDDLEDEQEDRAAHEAIWNLFTSLIPADQRDFITGFSIFTDGYENYLAAVNQSDRDPFKWELNVDIADSLEKTNLTYTLLHEHGHLLTLNSVQVEVSLAVHKNPYDEEIYQSEVSVCPQYFTGEGCSNSNSYINQFFNRFWLNLYAEWQVIDDEEDEDTRSNLLDDFYDTYEDQFLTNYAPTSPAEDIAESWAFFVLSPKPELNSITNEKILFFYEYPELVQLRAEILNSVCLEFQQ